MPGTALSAAVITLFHSCNNSRDRGGYYLFYKGKSDALRLSMQAPVCLKPGLTKALHCLLPLLAQSAGRKGHGPPVTRAGDVCAPRYKGRSPTLLASSEAGPPSRQPGLLTCLCPRVGSCSQGDLADFCQCLESQQFPCQR